MEELLSYLKYNYLICFDIDGSGSIHITGSSNRVIKVEELRYVAGIFDESLSLPIDSKFTTYFKLQSKDKEQLSNTERAILASIINFFKTTKRQLLKTHGISFDKSQIVFILPLSWTEELYKDKLRAFFLETEWIAPEDGKNKLLVVPFVQALAGFLHTSAEHKRDLDRERTSLLFSMQPTDGEDDTITFSYTCFQLQSAKELIAVSKTLASSDFLLVPSIRNNESISFKNLNKVMHNAVKQIVISIQDKHLERMKDGDIAEKEDSISELVARLPLMYHTVYKLDGHNTTLKNCLKDMDLDNGQLQGLKTWSCGQFITKVFGDANVKHYSKQVCNFFRKALDEYDAVRNSPDGIQHILLYSHSKREDFRHYIMQALIEENIIQPGNEFIEVSPNHNELAPNAMQKAYKMVQVANAILPPIILNKETQDGSIFQMDRCSDNLMAPNSFYVQASITEKQISFILNKVIQVSSSKNAVDLFTVQERSIDMEDVAETASHMLWNYYQAIIDMKEHQDLLTKCCRQHDSIELSSSHYKEFSKNLKKLVDLWFETEEHTFSREGLDSYHLVSLEEQCTCALKLSQRLLLEVGLRPSIANIAIAITGTLLSNEYFGLYPISALIVKGNVKAGKNMYFSYSLDRFLKEALQKRFQVQHRRVSLLFYDTQVDRNEMQYLGRGDYSQISSTTFTIKIEISSNKGEIIYAIQEDGVCTRIPSRPCCRKWGRYYASATEYLVLARGEDLPLAGINKTFLIKDCDLMTLDPSQGDINQHRVWSEELDFFDTTPCAPISVKISPEHSSSTVKISASYLVAFSDQFSNSDKESDVYDVEESINIHERLFLRKEV
ncbi:hypothetical protein PS6_006601 [Mucor atramentarius]